MSAKLIPCGGCGRHVMSAEPECPFCGGEIDAQRAVPGRPTRRLNRAATWAFGAAVAASAAAGCGESHDVDAGSGVDAGSETDAGTETDAGNDVDAGFDAGNIAPPYGAPVEDAGIVPEDAGFAPLYGGAPED